jgi:hypothetical protein
MLRTPIEVERTGRQAGQSPEVCVGRRLIWSRRPVERLVVWIQHRRKLPTHCCRANAEREDGMLELVVEVRLELVGITPFVFGTGAQN